MAIRIVSVWLLIKCMYVNEKEKKEKRKEKKGAKIKNNKQNNTKNLSHYKFTVFTNEH